MRLRVRGALIPVVFLAAVALSGCQSASATDSVLKVDDYLESVVTPSTLTATPSSGKTYRVTRTNAVDDIYQYAFTTSFSVTLTLNSKATSDDVALQLPVKIVSATPKVQQASGGVVVTPSGTDVEHYESTISNATGNSFAAVNTSLSMGFQVWYTLPNGSSEALITTTISCKDNEGTTFTKFVYVNVSPQ